MLAKYRAVLLRPKFKLSAEVVASLLNALYVRDQFRPQESPALPDPEDRVFLGTALATDDKILVTGNTAHSPIETCRPVRVMTPAEAVLFLP